MISKFAHRRRSVRRKLGEDVGGSFLDERFRAKSRDEFASSLESIDHRIVIESALDVSSLCFLISIISFFETVLILFEEILLSLDSSLIARFLLTEIREVSLAFVDSILLVIDLFLVASCASRARASLLDQSVFGFSLTVLSLVQEVSQ